jgi:hypothetical protein
MAWTAWTTDGLAAQLLGETGQDRNASGGTIPDRLKALVRQAGMMVWYAKLWPFRRTATTDPPYFHYSIDPWSGSSLADSASPTWPAAMHTGWHLAARWLVYDAFLPGPHDNLKKIYEDWVAEQWEHAEAMLTGATAASTATNTVDGLSEHIRSVLGLPRTPDVIGQVYAVVKESGIALWNSWDWRFRAKQGTLTLTTDDSYKAAPDDFCELDQRWLKDAGDGMPLQFTEDVIVWQKEADRCESGETGIPRCVAVVRNTAETTSFKYKFIVTPTADGDYSYSYWYLMLDPWSTTSPLADTAAPIWPSTFNKGWRLLALSQCARIYQKQIPEGAAESYDGLWKDWLKQQLSENNETITTGAAEYICKDAYGDLGALTSSGYSEDGTTWPL